MHRGVHAVAQATELHRVAMCEHTFDHQVPRTHQPLPLLKLSIFQISQSRVVVDSVIFIDPKWTSRAISFCCTRKLFSGLIQPTVEFLTLADRPGPVANVFLMCIHLNTDLLIRSEVFLKIKGQQR